MPLNTLAQIRSKVRKLTGRNSATQITDAEIDDYVNQYYVYDMPDTLKLLKLKDVYTFLTAPNIDTYIFPSADYLYCAPPATCAGIRIDYYNNNESFYTRFPKRNFIEQVGVGNGGAGPYVGHITNTPFLRSVNPATVISRVLNVLLTGVSAGGVSAATDDGFGNWAGGLPGAIDYINGNFTVTFPAPIDAGAPIYAETVPYTASRPTSIMYFQNQLVLRPVPDNTYLVELNVMRRPTDLLFFFDAPELREWWQLLAYGAACKILVDNADIDTFSKVNPFLEEQILLCQRRVIAQGTSQRAATLFSENNQYPYGNNYPYI